MDLALIGLLGLVAGLLLSRGRQTCVSVTFQARDWHEKLLEVIKIHYGVGTKDGQWTCPNGPRVYKIWEEMLPKFSAEQAGIVLTLLRELRVAVKHHRGCPNVFTEDGVQIISPSKN